MQIAETADLKPSQRLKDVCMGFHVTSCGELEITYLKNGWTAAAHATGEVSVGIRRSRV